MVLNWKNTYISKIRLKDVNFGKHQPEIEFSDIDKRTEMIKLLHR